MKDKPLSDYKKKIGEYLEPEGWAYLDYSKVRETFKKILERMNEFIESIPNIPINIYGNFLETTTHNMYKRVLKEIIKQEAGEELVK